MSAPHRFRYVSSDRRVREDRRFVAGKGRFAADIVLPGMRHVALVTCPHPAARIVSIDKTAALAMPGVHYVLDGAELAAATLPLMSGLDTPGALRRPLAVDVARYAGEWVAAVVADSRALAEDAAEAVAVAYATLPFVLDGEEAYRSTSPPVHAAHGSNVLLDRSFVWGEVDRDFADSPHHLSLQVKWGRSSTVPIETFGVVAAWDPWREILDVYASIQMPKYPDQIAAALKNPGSGVRVHHDVDVGGSYGVKRGIKHTVSSATWRAGSAFRCASSRIGWRTCAAATRMGRSGCSMSRPRSTSAAYRALDEDARARQCRRLCGPLAVPARQAGRRHRRSQQDQERKYQVDRRGHQQDHAGRGARLRPGADQSGHSSAAWTRWRMR